MGSFLANHITYLLDKSKKKKKNHEEKKMQPKFPSKFPT